MDAIVLTFFIPDYAGMLTGAEYSHIVLYSAGINRMERMHYAGTILAFLDPLPQFFHFRQHRA